MKLDLLMKIPEKGEQEGLVDYAWRLSELYSRAHNTEIRKQKGQFFTPAQVSTFMAGLFKMSLESCMVELESRACSIDYNIYERDYILHNRG